MRAIAALFTLLLSAQACSDKGLNSTPNSTAQDAAFNALFARTGGGWTGGDGAYSVALPDGRTLWLFGDTFLGSVAADGTRSTDTRLINNSLVIQDGDSLKTLHGGTPQEPSAFLVPESAGWYWPLDGTTIGDRLYLFFAEFERTGTGMWDFRYTGRDDVAVLSLPNLELLRVVNVSILPITYGAALLETSDYLYIYGLEDGTKKYVHLARAPSDDPLASWDYYVDNAWIADPPRSQRLFDGASNQFSVLKENEHYRLITQTYPFGSEIVSYTATNPWGPWRDRQLLYTTPEADKNIFTYNAVAHPQFYENGELLISYNVNSFEFVDLFKDATIYRPRFVRTPFPAP